MARFLRRRFLLIPALLLGLAVAGVAADWLMCLPEGRKAAYVGRQTCAECHSQEVERWSGSHHDLAMDVATPQTVLGNFDDQEFTNFGVTSRMFREGDKFFVTTEGASGELETFEVKYTFGVTPLQQYMVEFPDGRVQVLSIAWDTEKKRWFHLYPDEKIEAGDWLHWTGGGQNWNYMCAECHSTNVAKNYDLKTDTYHTTFSEIDVSCEACHGPGSIHVELARKKSLFWDRRYGYGLPAALKGKDHDQEIETCARCHSRRRIVHPDYHPGDNFFDFYEPELLHEGLYHADGQILEEVYEYGSFTQSLMYRKGVRCTDCHEPHSLELKAEGNNLCNRCHTPGKYDTPAHHNHPVGSQGSRCVDCHMPERTYMVVDPRRDHNIRVPRPDLSVALGLPNACNACHKDQTAEWARDYVVAWYGPKRREDPHYALALAAGRSRQLEPGALPEGHPHHADAEEQEIVDRLVALTKKKDTAPIVRATAISLLAGYGGTRSVEACRESLSAADPLSRAAAVRSLEVLVGLRANDVWNLDRLPPEQGAQVDRLLAQLQELLVPLLSDSVRVVRVEAARVLSLVPQGRLRQAERQLLAQVLGEFEAGQRAAGDQAAAHLNLGAVYGNQQRFDEAEEEYRAALRLDPDFVPARINLAMQYDHLGRKAEAEKLLREVTELAPELAEGHYSLGLLLAEDPARLAEAADALEKAAELAPDNARMHYNLGLAQQQLGRVVEAEAALRRAHKLQPRSPDFLHALAVLFAQQERWPAALACAEEMARLVPGRPEVHEFVAYLRRQAEQGGPRPE